MSRAGARASPCSSSSARSSWAPARRSRWARGVGVSSPLSRTAPWIAVALGVDGRLRFTRELSMVIAIDLLIPVSAPRFVIDVEGTSTRIGVFEPLPVALSAGLGLAAQFP